MQVENAPESFHRFIGAPADRLFAVFDDVGAARAGIDELRRAVDLVGEDDIWVLVGEEGARRLDLSGREHGLHARVLRFFQQQLSGDLDYVRLLDKALHKGGIVVAVLVRAGTAAAATEVVRRHGGHLLAQVAHWDYVPVAA